MGRRAAHSLIRLAAISALAFWVASAVGSREVGSRAPSTAGIRDIRPRLLRTPLYGLTVDAIDNLGQLIPSLRALPQRPTTRIVFDLKAPATYYAGAVNALRPISNLMGELLDSSDVPHISTADFSGRVRSYVSAFRSRIDLWEIGNEANGGWLGPYRDVEAKLVAAYNQVSAVHERTALTLFYNLACGDGSSELDPVRFSRQYVPRRVRNGLNYVLLSYYEQNCGGLRPSASSWTNYFSRLHRLYPRAQLGFGEIGLTEPVRASTLAYAEGMIRYYYGLSIRLPYYVGGYFWWYCDEDCVPYKTKPLWRTLRKGFLAEASLSRRRR